jgi:flagellar biogenesis protein FliO
MFLASRSLLAEFGPLVAKAALVLALVALAAWAAARFLGPRLAARRGNVRMRLVERLPLEPRRGLYLVEIDGEPLVVAATEHGVAFHAPARSSAAPASPPAPPEAPQ